MDVLICRTTLGSPDHVKPVYPPLALAARISGSIVFQIKVTTDGSVKNITLISGHPLLVAAARETVER